MPDVILYNTGVLGGLYDGRTFDLETTQVETLLIDGITFEKTVDKAVWVNGDLTYTITIRNNAEQAIANPVFTDRIEIDKVVLLEDTIRVNGATTTHQFVAGLLTINLANIAIGGEVVITFQVRKI